jgi:hypothetical protein
MDNPCKELWYEQRIKELEVRLEKAMQVIAAFCDNKGYVPKSVAGLIRELDPEEWDADTWRDV